MSKIPGTNQAPDTSRPSALPAAPPPVRLASEYSGQHERAAQRFEVAKAALTGLLAATPAAAQATSNAEQYATRAVRYADALLEALNRTTAEAMSHACQR
jgi:hypothetical protein